MSEGCHLDELTPKYRQKGLSEEVIKTEFVWQSINFLCCDHVTKEVRGMYSSSSASACMTFKLMSFMTSEICVDLERSYRVPDFDDRRLSKLLKCIVFVQDLNRLTTRSSEILGDNARYVVKDTLGKPIFTGSSEEGLAIFGDERMNILENYDKLSYRLNHDIDIMYESDKLIAHELSSYTNPMESSGVLNILMRPGMRAGYVTLQKWLPKELMKEAGTKCYNTSECFPFGNLVKLMPEIATVSPKPHQYVGQECALYYIQTMAFLKDCEKRVLPRDCDCSLAYLEMPGKDPNRHGDLCNACSLFSLKEIHRGKDTSPTKIWSDIVRIEGPSVYEILIVENESDPSRSREPLKITGFMGNLEILHQVRSNLRKRRQSEDVEPKSVEPKPDDIFSSRGRKTIFIDHVPAIKCTNWPSAAWEFTVRERPSGWPSEALVKEIVAQGCHVIPRSTIPPPATKREQTHESRHNVHDFMEWRLSFSVAEKILSASLNYVQVKCYMLLKMLHEKIKEEIKSFKDDDEELGYQPIYVDSYYLKTTFYWVCEEIPLADWNDDNLGTCFILVLIKLITFLQNGKVPNYFIPTSNLITHANPLLKLFDSNEYAFYYMRYLGKTPEDLFESLQTIVWSSLWCDSAEKPPGCTPQDLKLVKSALSVHHRQAWKKIIHVKGDNPKSVHRVNGSTCEVVADLRSGDGSDSTGGPFTKHTASTDALAGVTSASSDNVSNDANTKPSDISQAKGNDHVRQKAVACSTPQWPCRLDCVLAHTFAAISKFIFTHGNIYGNGVNTTRAAFYESEARKLNPKGYPLKSLQELYELVESSDESDEGDSDYMHESDESEDE